MSGNSSFLLVATLVTPAAMALGASLFGARHPRRWALAGALTAGVGFLAAGAMAVQAGRGTPASAAVGGFIVSADRLAAMLLLLVFGVSCVVQAFAVRYLAGDPRAAWFTAGAALLTAASAGLVTSATLIGLAISWTVAGVALCLLLATYWHLPAARDGVRRTATAFVIGDLALWTAVGIATARWGTIDLRTLDSARFDDPLLPAVACLIVLAALSRSAQLPFHRWLPATLAAPTPVSALLHAGVVNAGGILLVRLAPLITGELARGLTIVAGLLTMIYGATIMMVKPDIKGALANSTMAQMGFMILTCGLGLWAATIFHLVAHGFYKATLFLSSGSAIAQQRRAAARPPAPAMSAVRRVLTATAAVTLPAIALAASVRLIALPPGDHTAEQVLLIFAWVTGTAATWGWLARRRGIGAAVTAVAVLLPVAVAYRALVAAVSGYLAPALHAGAAPAALGWSVMTIACAVLAALAVLRWMPDSAVHRAVYARAISAGHPSIPVLAQPTGVRS
ncbi:proton-conducting transporter transmembrane domain-containing protein [Mycolicibacterium sp. CBM1]